MKALKSLPSNDLPLADAFTPHTYVIEVKNGVVQNPPSYVRVGDHVTWTIEGVVPSSVAIDPGLKPDFFTDLVPDPDPLNNKVTFKALTVQAEVGTKITYKISGKLCQAGENPEVSFSTDTEALMVDSSGKPPGCQGCQKPPYNPRPKDRRPKIIGRG